MDRSNDNPKIHRTTEPPKKNTSPQRITRASQRKVLMRHVLLRLFSPRNAATYALCRLCRCGSEVVLLRRCSAIWLGNSAADPKFDPKTHDNEHPWKSKEEPLTSRRHHQPGLLQPPSTASRSHLSVRQIKTLPGTRVDESPKGAETQVSSCSRMVVR